MTRSWRPADPDTLGDLIAERLLDLDGGGPALRVALDGPRCADPVGFADALVAPLRSRGRPAVVVRADTFWRDASLRLEYGREDPYAYRSWLDTGALRREVLEPLGPDGSRRYLPSLRNPQTNRSNREPYVVAARGTVLLVAGEFLLGDELPFDVSVHLLLTAAARTRRTPPALQWTLDAHADYDASVTPAEHADIAVKLDDLRHPAVSTR